MSNELAKILKNAKLQTRWIRLQHSMTYWTSKLLVKPVTWFLSGVGMVAPTILRFITDAGITAVLVDHIQDHIHGSDPTYFKIYHDGRDQMLHAEHRRTNISMLAVGSTAVFLLSGLALMYYRHYRDKIRGMVWPVLTTLGSSAGIVLTWISFSQQEDVAQAVHHVLDAPMMLPHPGNYTMPTIRNALEITNSTMAGYWVQASALLEAMNHAGGGNTSLTTVVTAADFAIAWRTWVIGASILGMWGVVVGRSLCERSPHSLARELCALELAEGFNGLGLNIFVQHINNCASSSYETKTIPLNANTLTRAMYQLGKVELNLRDGGRLGDLQRIWEYYFEAKVQEVQDILDRKKIVMLFVRLGHHFHLQFEKIQAVQCYLPSAPQPLLPTSPLRDEELSDKSDYGSSGQSSLFGSKELEVGRRGIINDTDESTQRLHDSDPHSYRTRIPKYVVADRNLPQHPAPSRWCCVVL